MPGSTSTRRMPAPRPRRSMPRRRAGRPAGRLFGLPVGVKDIYDTADYPTENGCVLDSGRRPGRDAWVVSRLRAEGAVILGKTVTTEYACFAPGPTRNPHDPSRTPGGSSSGSAAAVAAGMVPLALGSQTNGSVIRPASFCGVYGLKPSFGLIPRTGCLTTSRTLDHVGFFARSLEDLALLARGAGRLRPGRPRHPARCRRRRSAACWQSPSPCLPASPSSAAPPGSRPSPPRARHSPSLRRRSGGHLHEVELPAAFADAIAVHRTIWTAELAFHLRDRWERGADRLSPQLQALIEDGRAAAALTYQEALAMRAPLCGGPRGRAARARRDRDAGGTRRGAARPRGHRQPRLLLLWTLAGLPALSLPLLHGPNGLPLGCQLVAGAGDDARLLRLARWTQTALASPG